MSLPEKSRAHLAEAFRWSAEPVEPADAFGAALAMAVPVLVGAMLGHTSAGFLASLGGLALGARAATPGLRAQAAHFVEMLAPIVLATLAAALVGGRGSITGVAIVALAGMAAILGGYSRPLATGATRFALFLVIAVNAVDGDARARVVFLALVIAGALWATFVDLTLGIFVRAKPVGEIAAGVAQPSTPTARQKFARWRKTLRHRQGWQYALRLALCLSVAYVLQALWPEHHMYWVAVTAAILLQRQIEVFPVRTTQRAIGVALGLCLASLLLAFDPPLVLLVAGIAVLAGLRPLLRPRNYLAYCAVMTPLIVLMVDAGATPTPGLLIDRLAATLIGAGVVLALNRIAAAWLSATV
jgi:hypothetical protein